MLPFFTTESKRHRERTDFLIRFSLVWSGFMIPDTLRKVLMILLIVVMTVASDACDAVGRIFRKGPRALDRQTPAKG